MDKDDPRRLKPRFDRAKKQASTSSQDIAKQIEEFQSKGNEIQQIERGVSGEKWEKKFSLRDKK